MTEKKAHSPCKCTHTYFLTVFDIYFEASRLQIFLGEKTCSVFLFRFLIKMTMQRIYHICLKPQSFPVFNIHLLRSLKGRKFPVVLDVLSQFQPFPKMSCKIHLLAH